LVESQSPRPGQAHEEAFVTSFAQRVDARELTVAVVGLGYVGLPLALGFAERGFKVVGFDVVTARIDALNAGHSHVDDISHERLADVVASGHVRCSVDPIVLADADVIFVCVPTPFDRFKTPDLSFVQSATATVAAHVRQGALVILQSTTYPGTTTDILRPAIEARGLVVGQDVYCAFSPERVDPGNTRYTVRNTPKVVGGTDPESAQRARVLLESVMDEPGLVTVVSSPEAAELTKLLENTYRAVNIALVNELAQIADRMGIDIWEVIDAAATKPFGFQAFYPGIGPGGHCIPVDPYYLSWKSREFDLQAKFIELAADTNLQMAPYVIGRITKFLNRHSTTLRATKVLALGAAFKANVSDVRNSRALAIMELLADEGAVLDYADPMVPSMTVSGRELTAVDVTTADLNSWGLIVVLVPGAWPIDKVVSSSALVFDAVNGLRHATSDRLERL
jgi:UDP-N-acetyl-D-glucosamine dehydrogenase